MPFSADDFEDIEELGRGGAGKVWLATQKASGEVYALKRSHWPVDRLDAQERGHLLGEVSLLRELHGPGAAPAFAAACAFHGCFEDASGRLNLVLEHIPGGALVRHLRAAPGGRFAPERARHYLGRVAAMLGELHGRGVVYRDLKLTNLLLEASGQLRLVDFGSAKRLERSCDVGQREAPPGPGGALSAALVARGPPVGFPKGFRRTYSIVGTEFAMAPELLEYEAEYNEDGYCEVGYTFPPDWWSLGILACELLSGRPPWGLREGEHPSGKAIQALASASPESIDWTYLPGPLAETMDETLPLSARSFVMGLLQADPSRRLGGSGGCEEVCAHAFFADFDWEEPPPAPDCEAAGGVDGG